MLKLIKSLSKEQMLNLTLLLVLAAILHWGSQNNYSFVPQDSAVALSLVMYLAVPVIYFVTAKRNKIALALNILFLSSLMLYPLI